MSELNSKLELWSKVGKKLDVVIRNGAGESAGGEVWIQEWNPRERTTRALKFGATLWGLAIGCVFIPFFHFFLVPGFLVAGPITAMVILGKEAAVLGGRGTCPSCHELMQIARSAPKFPIADVCDRCQAGLKIDQRYPSSVATS